MSMVLDKKDLKQIKEALTEVVDPYFTAIKEDFSNIDDRFDKIEVNLSEIKDKLSNLERRVIALEDIATEHGKELRKIRRILAQLLKQKKVETEKVALLEKRIIQLEAGVV